MIKDIKFYFAMLLIFVLGGCSSRYEVTFESNPSGAELICSGKNWGFTPYALSYDESVKKQSSLNVSDCSANWVSGAKTAYPSNIRVFPSGGTTISVNRPRGNGYAEDAGFALQKRQTEAAERAARAAKKDNSVKNCITYSSGYIHCW